MTIIYIILGAIIWQAVCSIVCIATSENEDIVFYTATGVWAPILMVTGKLYQKICLAFYRRYNCYQVFAGGTDDYNYHRWLMNICMTPKTAAKFRTVDEYGYDYAIKLLREGKDFKSCPMKYEIVEDGQMFPAMSEDLFKKFLRIP